MLCGSNFDQFERLFGVESTISGGSPFQISSSGLCCAIGLWSSGPERGLITQAAKFAVIESCWLKLMSRAVPEARGGGPELALYVS